MFFSQLVLPRVGAPRATFVTKTAVKCMRPHSLGDSSSTEFLSHFPSAGTDAYRARRPAFLVLPARACSTRVRVWRNAKPLPVVVAKILTPLRGDTTALYSFDRNRSPFLGKQKRRRVGRGRGRGCCAPGGPLRRAYSSRARERFRGAN